MEFQAKKEKGLYFRCDEKYTKGDNWKNRELRVLKVREEDEEIKFKMIKKRRAWKLRIWK